MRRQLLIVGVSALLIGGGSGFVGATLAQTKPQTIAITIPSPEISPIVIVSPSPMVTPKGSPKPTANPTMIPIVSKPTPKPVIKPSPKPTPKLEPHKVTWNDPTPALSQGEIDGPTAIGTGVPITVTGTWSCTIPPKYGFAIVVRDLNTMQQVGLVAPDSGIWTLYYNGSSIPGHVYLLIVEVYNYSANPMLCDWNLIMTV